VSKELWINAHDELIAEYLEAHPEATEAEAIEATVARVDDRYADNIGDMIDRARDLAKERGL
jgi:hypothetical protein